MTSKTNSKVKTHPFDRIEEWSVTSLHGIPLHINVHLNIPFVQTEGRYTLDVEDDESGSFVGIGIYERESNSAYYWSEWELARQLTIPKFIAHNGISDLRKLQAWGFKIDESWLVYDTQLIGHIVDSSLRTYGMKDMTKRELGFTYPAYDEICGKKGTKGKKTLADFPAEKVAEYNACDTYYTFKLYEHQLKQLRCE